jgi:hypothetical protein
MWFGEHSIEPVRGATTAALDCDNCSNPTKHVLVDQPHGIGFGIPFMSRPLWSSHRAYALACPICGNISATVSKDQAKALMEGRVII